MSPLRMHGNFNGGKVMVDTAKRMRMTLVAGAISMIVILSGVPSDLSMSAEAAETYRLVVGTAQKPDTLNVFAMALSISYTVNFLVYDTLNSVERDFSPGPQLAKSWETDSTNKNWTFHLNENAVWHDGTPVTAEDVNFTLRLVIRNRNDSAALWGDYLSNIQEDGVKATGPHTVEIRTDVPKATMLTMMVPILPKHIWSEIPEDEINTIDPWDPEYFPIGPVGSGPLKLVSYSSTQSTALMEKNRQYFIDLVVVDEVMFKFFGGESPMVNALLSGDIDVAMDVPARLWESTLGEEGDGLDGQVTAALSFYELGINCASAEWREAFEEASDNLETTNLSVRQAIAMATEKDYMVNTILRGFADPGESIIPTATPSWHYYVPPDERWDYDIEGAKALLDAAGYQDLNGDGTRENITSGVELQFTLYYRKGYVDEENCAVRISDALAQLKIGIELIEAQESSVLWDAWMNCAYDLFIWGWDTDVDPNFMLSTFTEAQYPVDPSDSTKWGDAFWINEDYEALYIAQQQATDLEDREEIVREMQRMLYYHCPYVVLYYPYGLHAYNDADWTNYPDMVNEPGATPGTMWFFFDVTPVGYVDTSPTDVDAGLDRSCVVGEKLAFFGEAYDPDDALATLNWTWSFDEPDDTAGIRYGMNVNYTFNKVGNVTVTLTVKDPDYQTASDELVVEVRDMPADAGWLQGFVKDQFSQPVKGADVDVSGEQRTTDDDGSYSIIVSEGTYSVLVTKKGYLDASGEYAVAAGQVTWANLTMQLVSGTIEGHVRDAKTGDPVESASVRISYGSVTLPVFITKSDGYFQILNVEMGEVNVNASKTGYEDNVSTALVQAGQTTALEILLTPVDEGGTSTLALVAILAVAAIAALLVAYYFIRKKGKAEEPPPPVQ